MKNNKNKKGFTIVELVIVIAVIAILAAVLIPTFSGVVEKANQSKALQEAKNALTDDLVKLDADVNNYEKPDYMDYQDSDDTEINASATYYTRTGDGTDASPYIYTEVETPDVGNIASYYEKTLNICAGTFVVAGDTYTYTIESSNGDYTATYANGEWSVDKN